MIKLYIHLILPLTHILTKGVIPQERGMHECCHRGAISDQTFVKRSI